jgi:hypothetical protein
MRELRAVARMWGEVTFLRAVRLGRIVLSKGRIAAAIREKIGAVIVADGVRTGLHSATNPTILKLHTCMPTTAGSGTTQDAATPTIIWTVRGSTGTSGEDSVADTSGASAEAVLTVSGSVASTSEWRPMTTATVTIGIGTPIKSYCTMIRIT